MENDKWKSYRVGALLSSLFHLFISIVSFAFVIAPSVRYSAYIWLPFLFFETKRLFPERFYTRRYVKIKSSALGREFLEGLLLVLFIGFIVSTSFFIPSLLAWHIDKGELGTYIGMIFAYMVLLSLFPLEFAFLTSVFIYYEKRNKFAQYKPLSPVGKILVDIYLGSICAVVIFVFGNFLFWGRDIPPIDDGDLRLSKVEIPREQNAYYDLIEAYRISRLPASDNTLGNILKKPVNSNEVKELIRKNQAVLPYLDKAVSRPYFQSPQLEDPNQVDLMTEFPEYPKIRLLAQLCLLKAKSLAYTKRGKEAVELLIKVVKLGQMIEDSPRPSLITYLVGMAIKEIGLKGLRDILPLVSLDSDTLRSYAEVILRFKESEEGLGNAGKMEYLVSVNTLHHWEEAGQNRFELEKMKEKFGKDIGRLAEGMKRRELYKPNKTRKILADYYRQYLSNARKLFYKDMHFVEKERAEDVQKETEGIFARENLIGRFIVREITPTLSRTLERKCLSNFSVEATSCLFALKAYKIDRGELPTNLNELVPKYLSNVPLDPFDGLPLRYSKDVKVIYCVGKILRDLGPPPKKHLEVIPQGVSWTEMVNPTFKINL